MSLYVAEQFTPDEQGVLRRYFTNLDEPVFALVNLPEVVKGALFARYSRTHKSLRRLFLDEFVGDLDMAGDLTVDATVGVERAEKLYERVFVDYGDDSVAQLGGVHLACEQASIVLTKILEWGRLMAYLEQSTRFIAYDGRLPNGRYRYFRDPQILESTLGARYVGDIDRMFDTYAELLAPMQAHLSQVHPKKPGDSDFVHRNSIRAKAFDALRGLLPAATISNLGMYGSGQSYEQMILRMRAHPLPEARAYGDLMLRELRKVIPSFLERVDRDDRGVAKSAYIETNRVMMEEVAATLFGNAVAGPAAERVTLTDFDPDGEDKVIAAMLYPYTHLSESELLDRVQRMAEEEKRQIVRAYVGQRGDRRHKPGRAFERVSYRFDICSDYGAFRDLQRHRMLTIEWQNLSPHYGYNLPEAVEEAGLSMQYRDSMDRSAALYDALSGVFPNQAPYALALAHRIRYAMQFNAREAMHVLELRSGPQGHPEYRRIAQEMHALIAEQAGHRLIAESMTFVDHERYAGNSIDAEHSAPPHADVVTSHPR
jgi:thymidylate synthase ThyX